ncbi:hypothetical protein GmHk_09G026391 [Glycine max]|nr:hypothetical protein GmHk_09G026391 [Glycine max]
MGWHNDVELRGNAMAVQRDDTTTSKGTMQGLVFRGHDESTNSANQETTNVIITDLGDELFAIIVDEARDISNKEQMTIALRYVNKKGSIVEHFIGMGRSRRGGKAQAITTEHHYRVELFYTIVDMQLQELNDHFTETNTQLLLCMNCLNPTNLFSTFDKMLDNQLETYIIDMRSNVDFSSLKGIKNLSEKLVETGRHIVYPSVYLLLKLAMIFPVVTSTVEKAFSTMKIVKNRLCNQLRDAWMNDCLVTYIEKDVFNKIDNELIIHRFQNMKIRRGQL